MNDVQMEVHDLINTVQELITTRPYSESYIKDLGYDFARFVRYCDQNDIIFYTPEIGDKYLHDVCGIEIGVKSTRCTTAQRVVNMLTEYHRLGVIVPRKTNGRSFPEKFSSDANDYMTRLKKDFKSEQTQLRMKTILLKFTEYLDQHGFTSMASVSADDVNTYYTRCLQNYGRKYVQDNVNGVKRFIHYLYLENRIPEDISLRIMDIHCSSVPKHIPDTFTDEEIDQIISVVDRDNSVGKRDYAILLVAARLGLRQSDIRKLKFENINWEDSEIHLVQQKTNVPLTLPLPRDVGWAIIDYLKNGRPKCDTPEIFVRDVGPYTVLTNYDWLLSKYMRKAGISMKNRYHHGFHTFRHSLATKMLKAGVPLTDIQEALGHVLINTTKVYTGVDLDQLAECSMEVPDEN